MSTVGTPKSPEQIQHDWDTNPRWKGITRTYTPQDVVALQGPVVEESHPGPPRRRGALGAAARHGVTSTRSAR